MTDKTYSKIEKRITARINKRINEMVEAHGNHEGTIEDPYYSGFCHGLEDCAYLMEKVVRKIYVEEIGQ